MFTIPLLALLGTVVAMAIGSLWYSPKTPMGRLHMQSLSSQEMKGNSMKKLFIGQVLLSFVLATAVVFIVTMSMSNGMPFSAALGFVLFNWLGFMVPVIGSSVIWGNHDPRLVWKKFFSDSASYLVTVLAVALVTSLFV